MIPKPDLFFTVELKKKIFKKKCLGVFLLHKTEVSRLQRCFGPHWLPLFGDYGVIQLIFLISKVSTSVHDVMRMRSLWMWCNATPPFAPKPFSTVETTQHCPVASFSASSIKREQQYFFSLKVSLAQLNDKPPSQFFPFGNQHNLSVFSWTGRKTSLWFVRKATRWESQRLKCNTCCLLVFL